MDGVQIMSLRLEPDVVATLAEILVEAVASGGSVSYMHPFPLEEAVAFWQQSLAAADAGERVVLGAMVDGALVGTVTLHLDCPPNQPHRGEIAKMMTRPSHRGQGIASALMAEAEHRARQHGRTLLTLITAEDEGAGPLYEKQGFLKGGLIPGFALRPHGGLTAAIIYWKAISET